MKFKSLLINIPLAEFTRRLFRGGGISPKGILMLPVYYIQLIAALPFCLLQYLLYGSRIKKTKLAKDPIFILGHYRSGTTYLHKLLASDPQFGVLTNYDVLLPNINLLLGKKMQPFIQRIINLLKIKNPFFHQSLVQLSEPGEEDDYLMNKASAYSAYWGLIYPKRWNAWLNGAYQFNDQHYADGWKKEYLYTLTYATFKNKGKQLVLKNPPNTERISMLLQMFPQAKFIYLHRNPFHLYYSMRNMWKNAILNYYSVQAINDEELDEIIFGHFEYLAEQYEKQKGNIPEGNLIELSYETLMSDPHLALSKIYSRLNIPGFDAAERDLLKFIEEEKKYTPFEYNFSDGTYKKIELRWGKYIRPYQHYAE